LGGRGGVVIIHVPRRFAPGHWGGTETWLAALAALGTPQRIVTTSALCPEPTGDCAGLPVRRHPYFYPVWPLDPALAARWDRSGGNLLSSGVAGDILRQPGLRLVHLHTGNRLGSQALLAARKRGVPTVITLHGGHFAIPAAERQALAGGTVRRGWEWGRALSLLLRTRRLLERVDAVVCVSPDEAAAVRAQLPRQRVRLIPGGVDPLVWNRGDALRARQAFGLGPGPVIACIARLDGQKDQTTLVQAWLRLPAPRPWLVLAGAETEPGYGARLAALAKGEVRLVVAGQRDQAALADLLAVADVAVLPSRHEPFGLAILEAWAAGRGVIAADTGGPRSLLGDGVAGALFPVGDVAALAALLNDARIPQWGRAAQAQVADHIWSRRLKALAELYGELGVAL
jgi:glycosyltransferase involved in cell wall biosynthesis